MAATDSLPTQDSGGLSITDWRRILAGDVMRAANGQARLGVIPAHTNDLVTSLSSMAVSVAPFNAVTSRVGAALGVEKLANDGAVTVALAAAPSSNSRIDVVWVRPQFVVSGDAANVPLFGATTGTAASIPTKPAIPAGALELATVRIPSTATTTQSSGVQITQTAPYTAAAGGTLVFRNDSEMGAFIPVAGTTGFRLDTRQMWAYDGSNWTLAQAGLVLIRPGAVTGGSLDAQGTVLVGNTSSVRIDDAFSSRYRHYRAVVNLRAEQMSGLRLYWTSGGVDRTDSVYFTTFIAANNGTAPVTTSENGTTSSPLVAFASTLKSVVLDILNPGVAEVTLASGVISHFGGAFGTSSYGSNYENYAINDGFRIACTTGAFASGDIKIYAYA